MSRRVFLPSPRVWTITPQDTEQYGQMERVSVVRAILKALACAWAAVRSKPNGVTNAPDVATKPRRERSATKFSPSGTSPEDLVLFLVREVHGGRRARLHRDLDVVGER